MDGLGIVEVSGLGASVVVKTLVHDLGTKPFKVFGTVSSVKLVASHPILSFY